MVAPPSAVSASSSPIMFWSSRRPLKLNSFKCGGRVSCGLQDLFTRNPSLKNKNEGEDELTPLAPMKQLLPYWRHMFSTIMTLSVAAEKMWTDLSWNIIRQVDMISDPFGSGKLINGGLIFQQNFCIKSYETGANGSVSLEVILSYLQDCALNHVNDVGLSVDGFGSSPEMKRRNLILIVCKTQVSVDCYPSTGDLLQVSTWLSAHKKNGYRRYFHVSDCKTGKTLIRANSLLMMMNKQTRKLSKCGQEIKMEFEPHLRDCDPIMDIDNRKLPELDETSAYYVRGGIIPELKDLDINQHVNHSKYIGLILEMMLNNGQSTPLSILETHEISAFTLEYWKECRMDGVLQSLSAISTDESSSSVNNKGEVEFNHLLRLENNGGPIVKGRTSWKLLK